MMMMIFLFGGSGECFTDVRGGARGYVRGGFVFYINDGIVGWCYTKRLE